MSRFPRRCAWISEQHRERRRAFSPSKCQRSADLDRVRASAVAGSRSGKRAIVACRSSSQTSVRSGDCAARPVIDAHNRAGAKERQRSPSESDSDTVNHIVEAARTSGSWLGRLEPFVKDPPFASRDSRRRTRGSAKSALFARLRPEDQPFAFDIGCARGYKRLRTSDRQTLAATLIAITKPPSSLVALSTTNLRGTSSATSNPA